MYNPEWYILAYNTLTKTNKDNNDANTIDKRYLNRINSIVNEMKFERYKWKDLKTATTDNRGFNQLLVSDWRDKLVQEVIYMILHVIYEPKFSDTSHGCRPDRGVHTALTRIRQKCCATEYFIKGDISNCYKTVNIKILLDILKKTIKDGRFIRLVDKMFRAGRFDYNSRCDKSYSGVPIANKLSSLLLNIYLNELDNYIHGAFDKKFNQLERRPMNKEYLKVKCKIEYRLKQLKTISNADKIEKFKSEVKNLKKQFLPNVQSKIQVIDDLFIQDMLMNGLLGLLEHIKKQSQLLIKFKSS